MGESFTIISSFAIYWEGLACLRGLHEVVLEKGSGKDAGYEDGAKVVYCI